MELCPVCKSDNLDHDDFVLWKSVFMIITLFAFPYGILYCWLPLALPSRHVCRMCGKSSKKKELLHIDWRERERLYTEQQQNLLPLEPYWDYWVVDKQKEALYKIARGKGVPFLLTIEEKKPKMNLIVSAEKEQENMKIYVDLTHHDDRNAAEYKTSRTTGYAIRLTEQGRNVLEQDEFTNLQESSRSEFIKWLEEKQKLVDIPIELSQHKALSISQNNAAG